MLRQDGVATQSIDARIGVEEEMTFRLDRRGPSVLEIEVAPAPEELTLANNRAAVVVNGVRDRLRVLLVSGEPHADRKSVVQGKSVSVRVDLGGRRIIKK